MASPSKREGLSATGESDQKPSVAAHHNNDTIDARDIFHKLQATSKNPLGGISCVDSVLYRASALTATLWVVLVAGVWAFASKLEVCEDPYTNSVERSVAKTAFFIQLVSLILHLVPSFLRKSGGLSAVLFAALTVQMIALSTNAILGWGPRAVVTDQFTGSAVFLFRWCEWIPLSGFLTLLAESADVPAAKNGWRGPLIFSLFQLLSTACGLVFPFCPNFLSWVVVMIISCACFVAIFPRVIARRNILMETARGRSMAEREYYDRRRFAYYLMLICAICWTVLVTLYFVNLCIHLFLPSHHYLRRYPALAMALDTISDVITKVFYTKVAVEAHMAVFSPDLRSIRQLHELRQLMSILWTTSSDVIVISTSQGERRTTTMFSPSFLVLIGAVINGDAKEMPVGSAALVLEADRDNVTEAYYVDTSVSVAMEGMYDTDTLAMERDAVVRQQNLNHVIVQQARRIIVETWKKRRASNGSDEPLCALPIQHCDGSTDCICEMKVSRHSSRTAVAVVRDVTERYRRFEAEARVHAEMIARQRDMHTANRFTRHEVKNGLLAGIELCDNFGQVINKLTDILESKDMTQEAMRDGARSLVETGALRSIMELDGTLRGVLNTVLAEVMAREVVHEVYQPKLEGVDVVELLASDSGLSKQRFPLGVKGDSIPKLMLDPQLIGHIHRNAVSNACKYGKQGGVVTTYVTFDPSEKQFLLQVINLPGDDHDALLTMGETAGEFVFAQGVRLQAHIKGTTEKHDSSGDGAWIMQKCAATMKGKCEIFFNSDSTEFRFSCPSMPVDPTTIRSFEDFVLPANTWGIAVDDSKIQRKLMSRILDHAGVDDTRKLLLGENSEDVTGLDSSLTELMDKHPSDRFLVIVDENLDYNASYNRQDGIYSGSLIMSQILARMPTEHVSRCLVLMRSANDSAADIALYTQRTHGYFPKAIMKRSRTREILAPMWAERFPGAES